MKKYRIRKYSLAWHAVRLPITLLVFFMLAFIAEGCKTPETDAISSSGPVVEVSAEVSEVGERFFPLTDLQRDLVERVVAAEGRGESVEAQMAIAQTIMDRAMLRCQTVDQVCMASNQFATPYMGDIPEKTKDAVRFVFDDGDKVFSEPVTHFYAWKLINPPYWTEDFTFLGEIGGTRFYSEVA